jgi:hypothetical protein
MRGYEGRVDGRLQCTGKTMERNGNTDTVM